MTVAAFVLAVLAFAVSLASVYFVRSQATVNVRRFDWPERVPIGPSWAPGWPRSAEVRVIVIVPVSALCGSDRQLPRCLTQP
jgi:hypothetical protein